MSANQLVVARDILLRLLADGPQKGATLKPRLGREFERVTGTRLVFPPEYKFSTFLLANKDVVDVVWPEGPGDVTVSLRPAAIPPVTESLVLLPNTYVPRAIWSAFTNPDPRRRRFFHRITREVVHYLEGPSASERDQRNLVAVASRRDEFIEVDRIDAQAQGLWMKDFLLAQTIPQAKRDILEHLSTSPYSSQLNAAFLATLGEHAETWRRFRTERVLDHIAYWARENSLSLDDILPRASIMPASVSDPEVTPISAASGHCPIPLDSDLRRLVRAAIDTMSDDELALLPLPARIVLRISKARGK